MAVVDGADQDVAWVHAADNILATGQAIKQYARVDARRRKGWRANDLETRQFHWLDGAALRFHDPPHLPTKHPVDMRMAPKQYIFVHIRPELPRFFLQHDCRDFTGELPPGPGLSAAFQLPLPTTHCRHLLDASPPAHVST